MRWLNVGDIHFEKLHRLFGDEGIAIQLRQLRSQLSYAREHSVPNVIVLGDVFDSPFPKQRTIVSFCDLIHEYRDLQWRIILGNHDVHNAEIHAHPFLEHIGRAYLPNLKIYTKTKTEVIDGVICRFLPWPSHRSKLKEPHVAFTHTEYRGTKRDSGMVSKDGVEYESRSGQFMISGHLHTFQEHGNLFYPGTALPFTFGDSQEKSFTVSRAVQKGNSLFVKHKHIAIDIPWKFITVTVNAEDDLKKVPREKDGNFYRLRIENPAVRLPSNWLANRPHVLNDFVLKTAMKEVTIEKNNTDIPKMIRRAVKRSIAKEDRIDVLRLLDRGFQEIGS